MTDLVNVWGSGGGDVVSDNTTATFTFKNTSSGKAVVGTNTSSGSGVYGENTGTGLAGKFVGQISGGATLAAINVVASVASQAVLSISGVFMSTASVAVTAATTAFIIPVYHETQKVFGYISCSKGVV